MRFASTGNTVIETITLEGHGECLFKAPMQGDFPATIRVARELAAMELLQTEGVPKVIRRAHSHNGHVGFVREFFEGPVVAYSNNLLQNDSILIRLTYGVLNILDQIHRKGLIHGDLSPKNIVIRCEKKMETGVIDFEHAERHGSPYFSLGESSYTLPLGAYRASPFVDCYSLACLLAMNRIARMPDRRKNPTPHEIIRLVRGDWRRLLEPMILNPNHPSLRSATEFSEALSKFQPDS